MRLGSAAPPRAPGAPIGQSSAPALEGSQAAPPPHWLRLGGGFRGGARTRQACPVCKSRRLRPPLPALSAGGEQEGDGRPAARGPARGTGAAGDGRRGTPRPRAGSGPRLQVSLPGVTRSSRARAIRGGAARGDPSPLGFPGRVGEGSAQVCLPCSPRSPTFGSSRRKTPVESGSENLSFPVSPHGLPNLGLGFAQSCWLSGAGNRCLAWLGARGHGERRRPSPGPLCEAPGRRAGRHGLP